MAAPIRCQAAVVGEGVRLATRLPFMRLNSTVRVSFTPDERRDARRGRWTRWCWSPAAKTACRACSSTCRWPPLESARAAPPRFRRPTTPPRRPAGRTDRPTLDPAVSRGHRPRQPPRTRRAPPTPTRERRVTATRSAAPADARRRAWCRPRCRRLQRALSWILTGPCRPAVAGFGPAALPGRPAAQVAAPVGRHSLAAPSGGAVLAGDRQRRSSPAERLARPGTTRRRPAAATAAAGRRAGRGAGRCTPPVARDGAGHPHRRGRHAACCCRWWAAARARAGSAWPRGWLLPAARPAAGRPASISRAGRR